MINFLPGYARMDGIWDMPHIIPISVWVRVNYERDDSSTKRQPVKANGLNYGQIIPTSILGEVRLVGRCIRQRVVVRNVS